MANPIMEMFAMDIDFPQYSRKIVDHGCFTLFPVRINSADEIANDVTTLFPKIKAQLYGRGDSSDANNAQSSILGPSGNLASLVFPESPPEKLRKLVYMMELMTCAGRGDHFGPAQVWKAFGAIASKTMPPKGTQDGKLVELLSYATDSGLLLETILMGKLNLSRDFLGKPMSHGDMFRSPQLKDYIKEACLQIDKVYPISMWAAVIASSQEGSRLNVRDFPLMTFGAMKYVILVRDFYTWDQDFAESKNFGGKPIRSAISVLMQLNSLPADEAKEEVRLEILHTEKSVLEQMTLSSMDDPEQTTEIKTLAMMLGGFHFWASRCPQYRACKGGNAAAAAPQASRSSDVGHAVQGEGCKRSIPSRSEQSPYGTLEKTRDVPYHKPPSEAILAPIDYICSMPTKGVCVLITTAFNIWIQAEDELVQIIKEAAQHLHDASLILDDIQDNSSVRRGKPAVHTVFGPAQTIHAANFMVVQVSQQVRKLKSQKAIDILLQELENLYLGQSLDIHWRFELKCPSEEEYLNMVDNKTGAFFRLIIRLLKGETYHPPAHKLNLERLSTLLGRFYQIRDDYMNLRSRLYTDQKGSCEDLDEGKFSYPIVHCLTYSPAHRSHIIGIFRQRPTSMGFSAQPLSPQAKSHIISCLEESGSLDATLKMVNQLEADIEAEVTRLEGEAKARNPMLRALLKKLSLAGGAA